MVVTILASIGIITFKPYFAFFSFQGYIDEALKFCAMTKILICPQIRLTKTLWSRDLKLGVLSKNTGKNFVDATVSHLKLTLHSMAGANLKKSVWLVTNTTAASKYIPRRPRISIN